MTSEPKTDTDIPLEPDLKYYTVHEFHKVRNNNVEATKTLKTYLI